MNESLIDKFTPVVQAIGNSIQQSARSIVVSSGLTDGNSQPESSSEVSIIQSQSPFDMLYDEMTKQTEAMLGILAVSRDSFDFQKSLVNERERLRRSEEVTEEDTPAVEEKGSKSILGDIGSKLKPSNILSSILGNLKKVAIGGLLAAYLPKFLEGFFNPDAAEGEGGPNFWVEGLKYLAENPIALGTVAGLIFGPRFGFVLAIANAGANFLTEQINTLGTKIFGKDFELGAGFTAGTTALITALGLAAISKTKSLILGGIAKATSAALGTALGIKPKPPASTPASTPSTPDDKAKAKTKLDSMSDKKLEKSGLRRTKNMRYQSIDTGKFVSTEDALDKTNQNALTKVLKKYPMLKKLGKIVKPLGYGLSFGILMNTMSDDSVSENDKKKELSKFVGSILGGAGGFALGGLVGAALSGPAAPLGATVASLGLGVAGSFFGEEIGEAVADYILTGKPTKAEPKKLAGEARRDRRRGRSVAPSKGSASSESPMILRPSTDTSAQPSITPSSSFDFKTSALSSSASAPVNNSASVIRGGDNFNNTNVGGSSSTTYNIYNSASKALSNNVPIVPSAGAYS